jgi:hypothetical protein
MNFELIVNKTFSNFKEQFKPGMGNFEISGSNNLFRHEKIASRS